MLRIHELKLPLDAQPNMLRTYVAKRLHCRDKDIAQIQIVKRAIDSRDKGDIRLVYHVDVILHTDEQAVLAKKYPQVFSAKRPQVTDLSAPLSRVSLQRPVVVGFGPAGMFAALTLAQAGLNPLILERGNDVDTRTQDVDTFWKTQQLNTQSNVQFGEGGAGTFSDGKLTTGIKNPLCAVVTDIFVRHGAPEEIRYSAKPHIGTDRLTLVVKRIRQEIIRLGGEIRFGHQMTGLIRINGTVHGITYQAPDGTQADFETDTVLLCIGHSARDTVKMLYDLGVPMQQKPFSVGARIEHPREWIDKAQYGIFAGHPALGAADYKLACHPPHGRGAYTFCMCPGGTVVNASSEEGHLVVNGMSAYARDAENSNSALLVGIDPADFPDTHPLSGIALQRRIESAAFQSGGGNYCAPVQLVGDFLAARPSKKLGTVHPSCPTGVNPVDLRTILPKKVTDTMATALLQMDRMLHGFALPDAVLTAAETRSSSPVRILRDTQFQSTLRGLFPCGEGAGYAGGIISAAVDGIRCAHAVMRDESNLW